MADNRPIQVLHVDLAEERVQAHLLQPDVVHKYIGGTGIAAKILWEETKAETVPSPVRKNQPAS